MLVLAATVLGAWECGGLSPFRKTVGYAEVRLLISSERQEYAVGEAVTLTLTATNTGGEPFSFDTTTGGPLLEPATPEGTAPPRPAYDVLFIGHRIDKGKKADYHWIWSSTQAQAPGTQITLMPGESRTLATVRWVPPPADFVQGGFLVRFADAEFPSSIHLATPRR